MSAKLDPFDLMDTLIAIVRARNEHISSEFFRSTNLFGTRGSCTCGFADVPPELPCEVHPCANSSAGLTEEHTLFPRHTPTPATPSPSGGAPSVLHIEDTWWKQQDTDTNWINQWDHDDTYDNTDPKSWK